MAPTVPSKMVLGIPELFQPLKRELQRQEANAKSLSSDINSVIMDYLVSEGYPGAAEKFAQETNLCAPSDVGSIRERVKIRTAICEGNVQEAIALVNEIDCEVSPRLCPPPLEMMILVSCTTQNHLRVLSIVTHTSVLNLISQPTHQASAAHHKDILANAVKITDSRHEYSAPLPPPPVAAHRDYSWHPHPICLSRRDRLSACGPIRNRAAVAPCTDAARVPTRAGVHNGAHDLSCRQDDT